MKTLKIKGIDSLINIKAGNIENIIIENSKLYFNIVNSIIIDDNDYLIYSIDNDNKDLEKYSLLITTPFDLNPNNKKILTALYKKIDKEKHILKINEELEIINYKIIKTLETNEYILFIELKKILHEKFLYNKNTKLKKNAIENNIQIVITELLKDNIIEKRRLNKNEK